ncbi:hypothetical protein DH2020_035028 [Rehmannia glutinosa]|uniref:Sulfotransferase n=1 Tax=Rehmannia glutinosa TaxID=99300 RepID=A0ABR0V7P5_REHGL
MSTSSNLSPPPIPDDVEKLLNDLPKVRVWDAKDIYQWEGFWFPPAFVKSTITLRSRFQARDDDIFLASTIKTGTTWLKALSHSLSLHHAPPVDIYDASAPRLLHTHLPYVVLSNSIKNSASKIVYITRNTKDTLISMWQFFNSLYRPNQDPFPIEKAFDWFCSGVHQFGPFFEHVVEYWQESQKWPQKILFMKYEELKSDPKGQVSKIAEFLGRPFADENEVDAVLWRCSLGRLKNLEVNKSGNILNDVPNKSLFRKGEVGDWKNYLTPEMEEQINQICRIKLEHFGLFL